MSAITLYHGTSRPFDSFDMQYVGGNFHEHLPVIFTTGSKRDACRWAMPWRSQKGVVLSAEVDSEKFHIVGGRSKTKDVVDLQRLTNWFAANSFDDEGHVIRPMKLFAAPHKGSGSWQELDIHEKAKLMAATAVEDNDCLAILDQYNPREGLIHQIYNCFHREAFNSNHAWSKTNQLLSCLGIDAIDAYGSGRDTAGEEVYIFESGLGRMPEWKLNDIFGPGYHEELEESGYSLGNTVIGVGNQPVGRPSKISVSQPSKHTFD